MVLVLFPIGAALTGIIGQLSPITLLLALYCLVAFVVTYKQPRVFGKANLIILLYFAYVAVGIGFGRRNVYHSWYITNVMLNAIVFFLATTDRYAERELQALQKSVIYGTVLAAVVAIVCKLVFADGRLIIRMFSAIDPNEFGFNMCFCATLLLANISRNVHKKESAFGLVICLIIIVLSGSRGSMLSFGLVFIVWFVLYGGQHRLKILLIGLVVCIGGYVVFHDKLTPYTLQRLNIFHSLLADGGAGRLSIWKAAIARFNEADLLHKIFGHGFGTFQTIVQYVAPGHTIPYESHNVWIDALITGGIVGCALLFFSFLAAFVCSFKNRNIWGVLSLIALLVATWSLDMQHYKAFALILVINVIYKKDYFAEKEKRGELYATEHHRSYI